MLQRAYLAVADQPLSAGSERAAFLALNAVCESAAAAWPTSISQDEQELATLQTSLAETQPSSQSPDPKLHMERLSVCLEWRLQQKRILRRGVELCNAVLAALGAAPAPRPDIASQVAALCRTPRW